MPLKEEFRTQGDFLFKHRSYLPILIILAGMAVYIFNQTVNPTIDLNNDYDKICLLIGLLGLVIRSIAVGYSADHTSGRNTSVGQVAEHINTTGFYSICRHPLYLGNYFMWLGVAMLTADVWFLVAFTGLYWIYYERIMYAEEAFLTEKYGQRYINWAKTVPAFIPAFTKWKKPEFKFSWPKIIRQERTGILNLFLLIFIFKSIGAYIAKGQEFDPTSWWFMGIAGAIVWYLITKIIQKTTIYLNVDRPE